MDVIEVHTSGPIFDNGGAEFQRAMAAAAAESEYVVGSQALANWHLYLNQSIKHPTPYYETQITVQNLMTEVIVHDRGIIYGPWLEGVSSRNQTTRFKGYHSLRKARQATVRQVVQLADPIYAKHLQAVS